MVMGRPAPWVFDPPVLTEGLEDIWPVQELRGKVMVGDFPSPADSLCASTRVFMVDAREFGEPCENCAAGEPFCGGGATPVGESEARQAVASARQT